MCFSEKFCFGRLAFSNMKTCLKCFQATLQITELNFSFITELSMCLRSCFGVVLCGGFLGLVCWFVFLPITASGQMHKPMK